EGASLPKNSTPPAPFRTSGVAFQRALSFTGTTMVSMASRRVDDEASFARLEQTDAALILAMPDRKEAMTAARAVVVRSRFRITEPRYWLGFGSNGPTSMVEGRPWPLQGGGPEESM